jgi:hypothetical protein
MEKQVLSHARKKSISVTTLPFLDRQLLSGTRLGMMPAGMMLKFSPYTTSGTVVNMNWYMFCPSNVSPIFFTKAR